MSVTFTWRVSGWDNLNHAFEGDFSEAICAEAICTHSALVSNLREPTPQDRQCNACCLLVGEKLIAQYGERQRSEELTMPLAV